MLGRVLRLAETLDVPEQATLSVYVKDIHAVMDIGQYCKDKRSDNSVSTRGTKYFKYRPFGGGGESGLEQEWVMMAGSEIERLGGEEEKQNFRYSLRVAHDGSLASLGQRLMVQGDQQ